MEEIYVLLKERLDNINDLLNKFNQYEISLLSSGATMHKSSELQEISYQINQLKKLEKMRIIKENDCTEVIFSLRNFDQQQRQFNFSMNNPLNLYKGASK